MSSIRYNRVLLKMGGEALAGPNGYGIDPTRATEVATATVTVVLVVAAIPTATCHSSSSAGARQGPAAHIATGSHLGSIGTELT